MDAWREARDGRGRTVVITGEPGVGKSRLLASLRETLSDEPHRWLALRCSPLRVNTAFHPVAGMMRATVGIRLTDPPEAAAANDPARRCPIPRGMPRHRSRRCSTWAPADAPAPEKFRRDLMEALYRWLLDLASRGPVVVAGEDLHWSDASTLELMRAAPEPARGRACADRGHAAPGGRATASARTWTWALTGSTPRTRASSRASWPPRADSPATWSTGGRALDGVPLFVEELVAAADEAEDTGLPTSLQSSLLARLDRLGPARDVAQMASVLGRSFPERLLAAVADIPADRLADALRRLTAAGILESCPSIEGRRLEFRHALIRDAAYESLRDAAAFSSTGWSPR